MAKIKKTRRGNWYAVHGVTGKILKGQPKGGYASARSARRFAAKAVKRFTGRSVSPKSIKRWK